MNSRTQPSETRSAPGRVSEPTDPVSDRVDWADTPALLKFAVVVAAIGAILLAVGPAVGVLNAAPGAAYGATPLLIVLAVLPVLVAVGLLATGRPIGAAGVLVGLGLLAPGRALVDFQLVSDALKATRPELVMPANLAPLQAGIGAWLLVAGHLLTLVAGAMVIVRAGAQPGSVVAAEFDDDEPEQRKRILGWGLIFGALAALGLVMPTYTSDNALLLSPDLMKGPGVVMVGGLLLALATVLGCVFAGTARTAKLGRGVLVGIALAVLATMLPMQVAGLVVDWLHTDWRSYIATFGIAGLIATAIWPDALARARNRENKPGRRSAYRLHVLAGVLAVLGGVAGILGGVTELFVVEIPTDAPINQTDFLILVSGVRPESFANRLLLPAAILLILLGALLLIRPVAPIARPAFSVGWVAVLFAAFLALDAVVTATGTSTAIRAGASAWWSMFSVLLAIAAAICAGAAGGVERDDVDLTDRKPNIILMAPIAAAILFGIGAFGLPTMRAPEYVAPGIWSNFRLASWGLIIAMLAVVIAAVIATRSRPSRAAALLFGAAALVTVHALEFPMTESRAPGATSGPGTWLSIACIAALVISAFVALAVRPEPARRR